jgi:large conductance mechanosensitive channel
VIKGFREFVMRGNVVELAVAVIMGAAFGAIVNGLVNDLIMPLITAVFGRQDYSNLYWTVNHSRIMYGAFLNAVISFLLIAMAVYFGIVMPLNKIAGRARLRRGLPAQKAGPTEVELLTDIRNALTGAGGGSGAGS